MLPVTTVCRTPFAASAASVSAIPGRVRTCSRSSSTRAVALTCKRASTSRNQTLIRIDGPEQRDGDLGVDAASEVQTPTLRTATDDVEHGVEKGAGGDTSRAEQRAVDVPQHGRHRESGAVGHGWSGAGLLPGRAPPIPVHDSLHRLPLRLCPPPAQRISQVAVMPWSGRPVAARATRGPLPRDRRRARSGWFRCRTPWPRE